MSNLCCVLSSIVHCRVCNTRWCAGCWSDEAKNISDKDKDPHMRSPRVCSLTKRVIGVVENRYAPWEMLEGKVGMAFGPLP